MGEAVGFAVGAFVGAGVAVGRMVGVAVGTIVGCNVGDSFITSGLSDTILTDSAGETSSIVKPKPTVLIISANTDIPADAKRFFAGFLRNKLIIAHMMKIGIHKKLMQNSKRNKLFKVNSPYLVFY